MNESEMICAALDAVAPAPGARERMLENIEKKASAEIRPADRRLRRAILTACCLCVLISGSIALIPRFLDRGEAENASTLTGYVVYDSPEAFEAMLDLSLDAPEGAEQVRYSIGSEKIACVDFFAGEHTYFLLATRLEGDVSGLYGKTVRTVPLENGGSLARLSADGETVWKAVWSDGDVQYCLANTDGAEEDEVLAVCRAVTGK
ncbi:MAG: hypothetical protein IJL69_01620 [Oscillospiraceae bacterium]|nr:hypothetical protein [Oscillospiraceae bacterium]